MISSVTFEKTTYAALPYKFEAGTPAVAEGDRPGRGDRLRAVGRVRADRGLRTKSS